MKLSLALVAAILTLGAMSVHADPDKDESGHGGHHERRAHKGGEYKEEYWDGHCKVERKWKRNGSYKEERKCDGPRRAARGPYHGDYPPSPRVGPAVVIQPPAVIIESPPVYIR